MKTFTMLEIATEVAWQVGDILTDKPRAESRWCIADIAQDIINRGMIDDTSEDIDEIISSYLTQRGLA
jgi:hypothetical protein